MSLSTESELLLFRRYTGTVQRTLSLTGDAVQLGNYVSVADVTLGDNGIIFHVQDAHAPAANMKFSRRGTPHELMTFLVQERFERQLNNAIHRATPDQPDAPTDSPQAKTNAVTRNAVAAKMRSYCSAFENQLRMMSSRGERSLSITGTTMAVRLDVLRQRVVSALTRHELPETVTELFDGEVMPLLINEAEGMLASWRTCLNHNAPTPDDTAYAVETVMRELATSDTLTGSIDGIISRLPAAYEKHYDKLRTLKGQHESAVGDAQKKLRGLEDVVKLRRDILDANSVEKVAAGRKKLATNAVWKASWESQLRPSLAESAPFLRTMALEESTLPSTLRLPQLQNALNQLKQEFETARQEAKKSFEQSASVVARHDKILEVIRSQIHALKGSSWTEVVGPWLEEVRAHVVDLRGQPVAVLQRALEEMPTSFRGALKKELGMHLSREACSELEPLVAREVKHAPEQAGRPRPRHHSHPRPRPRPRPHAGQGRTRAGRPRAAHRLVHRVRHLPRDLEPPSLEPRPSASTPAPHPPGAPSARTSRAKTRRRRVRTAALSRLLWWDHGPAVTLTPTLTHPRR